MKHVTFSSQKITFKRYCANKKSIIMTYNKYDINDNNDNTNYVCGERSERPNMAMAH